MRILCTLLEGGEQFVEGLAREKARSPLHSRKFCRPNQRRGGRKVLVKRHRLRSPPGEARIYSVCQETQTLVCSACSRRMLAVSGAFHTRLMEPASAALSKVRLHSAQYRLASIAAHNTNSMPFTHALSKVRLHSAQYRLASKAAHNTNSIPPAYPFQPRLISNLEASIQPLKSRSRIPSFTHVTPLHCRCLQKCLCTPHGSLCSATSQQDPSRRTPMLSARCLHSSW